MNLKFLLLIGLIPLASCATLGPSASFYSVKIVNRCAGSKSVYIDGTRQNTIAAGRSLTITNIKKGTHILQASGLNSLHVDFDQDKVWTLCP